MHATRRILLRLVLACVIVRTAAGSEQAPGNSSAPAPWKPHTISQFNGREEPFQLPARIQILTEPWNRVTAVPYLAYVPEKNRLVMLMSCDYPHHAMTLLSDDRGSSWTQPKPVTLNTAGAVIPGLGIALTYLGSGRLALATDRFYYSFNCGETWENPPHAETTPNPIPPAPDGKTWNLWDPMLVDPSVPDGKRVRANRVHHGHRALRGRRRPRAIPPPTSGSARTVVTLGRMSSLCRNGKGSVKLRWQWPANGDWVAACRTDIPARFKGETLDHYEGLAVSISKDRGRTWSNLNRLYDWGRHHPSMVVTTSGEIVMTYVVRKGYTDSKTGMPQFGVEAIVSRDHGQSWDLDHRYVLHSWEGNRTGKEAWWASSQATSTVLFPDGELLTTFGTGYRSQPTPAGPAPRDVGLVLWRLNNAVLNSDHSLRDAPSESDQRNVLSPAP